MKSFYVILKEGIDYLVIGYQELNRWFNDYFRYDDELLSPTNSLTDLKWLLESRGVNPNHNRYGHNALHVAAVSTVDQCVRLGLLLDHGTDVNSQCPDRIYRNTPLHLLIANENTECAIFLIDETRKRGINLRLDLKDINGCTALLLACKLRLESISLKILQEYKLYRANIDINACDKDGRTALDYAIILGQVDLAQRLFALGAKTSVINKKLSNLMLFDRKKTHELLEEVDIDADRDKDAKFNNIKDINKQTLLYIDIISIPLFIPARKDKDISETVKQITEENFPLVDSTKIINRRRMEQMSLAGKMHIRSQYEALSGISLLDACMDGQIEITYLQNKIKWEKAFKKATKIDDKSIFHLSICFLFKSVKSDTGGLNMRAPNKIGMCVPLFK